MIEDLYALALWLFFFGVTTAYNALETHLETICSPLAETPLGGEEKDLNEGS